MRRPERIRPSPAEKLRKRERASEENFSASKPASHGALYNRDGLPFGISDTTRSQNSCF